jgi:uncharacterized membrane protein
VWASIAFVALFLNWGVPSTLGGVEAFVLWCIVAVVIVVNFALFLALPPKKKPLIIAGREAVNPEERPTPEEKRARTCLYVSIPVLALVLNRLLAPSTFGTLRGFLGWLGAAAVLWGLGIMVIATIDDVFSKRGR